MSQTTEKTVNKLKKKRNFDESQSKTAPYSTIATQSFHIFIERNIQTKHIFTAKKKRTDQVWLELGRNSKSFCYGAAKFIRETEESSLHLAAIVTSREAVVATSAEMFSRIPCRCRKDWGT